MGCCRHSAPNRFHSPSLDTVTSSHRLRLSVKWKEGPPTKSPSGERHPSLAIPLIPRTSILDYRYHHSPGWDHQLWPVTKATDLVLGSFPPHSVTNTPALVPVLLPWTSSSPLLPAICQSFLLRFSHWHLKLSILDATFCHHPSQCTSPIRLPTSPTSTLLFSALW